MKDIFIIDDTGYEDLIIRKSRAYLENTFKSYPITWIYNSKKEGQIVSIDKIYSLVKTPFIFHCEDDWKFYKTGFIESSLPVLLKYPKCLQVWLREFYDTNGHPLVYSNNLWLLTLNYLNRWHGFSFNPGLRRLSDYKLLEKYSKHTIFDRFQPWKSEVAIGTIYKDKNYFAAILSEGYVHHIGKGRHVD
ncbi:MAG: hypothetical protein WBP45_05960 [Daejeonella sp.]